MNKQSSITDVLTIGVPVSDQGRALEFSLEKLGFESGATFLCRNSAGAGSRSHRKAQR